MRAGRSLNRRTRVGGSGCFLSKPSSRGRGGAGREEAVSERREFGSPEARAALWAWVEAEGCAVSPRGAAGAAVAGDSPLVPREAARSQGGGSVATCADGVSPRRVACRGRGGAELRSSSRFRLGDRTPQFVTSSFVTRASVIVSLSRDTYDRELKCVFTTLYIEIKHCIRYKILIIYSNHFKCTFLNSEISDSLPVERGHSM